MSDTSSGGGQSAGCGCCFGIGSILAAILSAALNHSFWWGALHFCLGGFYILYALIARSHEIIPALKAMFS